MRYLGSAIPAMLGVKHLRGAFPHEGRAARADCFTMRALLHPTDMDVEAPDKVRAVTQLIFLIHIASASGANKGT